MGATGATGDRLCAIGRRDGLRDGCGLTTGAGGAGDVAAAAAGATEVAVLAAGLAHPASASTDADERYAKCGGPDACHVSPDEGVSAR